MTIDPDTLNTFARSVATRFAEAAKGLDSDSLRFVKARPSERILAGFLTPMDADEEALAIEGEPAPELPSDDKYEQTHIGFEWAVPRSALVTPCRLRVDVGFAVFVRVFPTFNEFKANARPNNQGLIPLPEVWQRFALGGFGETLFSTNVDLAEAANAGSASVELVGQTDKAWERIGGPRREIFPGRQEHLLKPADASDAASYERWVGAFPRPANPRGLRWRPVVDIRVFEAATTPDSVRVLLRVVNRTEAIDRRTEAFVDPRLYAISLKATLPSNAHRPTEFRILPNSYRYDRRVDAVGINCQPRLTKRSAELSSIAAETVPIAESPRLIPRSTPGPTPTFMALADPQRGPAVLSAILAEMVAYDKNQWPAKIDALQQEDERRDAEQSREQFRAEIAQFRSGLAVLDDSSSAEAQAFRLMNESMMRAGRGRRREVVDWRLFQIVFVVSQIGKLSAIAHGDDSERPLDILWFPAGGGKTEAFLGLVVWHAFFDRLRGKQFGVTAFLRYPLRLLTYQQLQRVAWVLGQAEEVRVEHRVTGQPFSLGYYVGESTTPNSIDRERHQKLVASGVPGTWQRVFRCPSCGARSIALRYDRDLHIVEHYCQSTTCRTAGSRLPFFIVDDDLYRYLPTVIVSTVDKLAQIGQNRRFSQLLGRIELYCPLHGAAFGGSNRYMCTASEEAAVGRVVSECGGTPVIRGPFDHLGPGLHVQDEMHLLRESLATFDSHYETAALALQRGFDAGNPGWALIGATATIEGYDEQASHLYLRSANRFPAPGPEAYESFYYTVDPSSIGRLYVGVLGVGRTHTPSVARTLGLLYHVVEQARQLADSNLTAARKLVALPNASADEIKQLAFFYEIILTYVLTRKGGDQVGEAIDTRVRRDVEMEAGGGLRVETFNSNVDMPRMIATMEEIENVEPATPVDERVRGVVATNIISHGVDVDRFNIMVFAGLPRQFAEYIQASARVGRQIPGIAVLVVTPQSERDRSVFDRFDKCHQYVDRLVEPVPINRWSEPALEQTLRGVLAAYIMGAAPKAVGRELYMVGHVKELFGRRGAEALSEASVLAWVEDAIGANSPGTPTNFRHVLRTLTSRLYGQVTGASPDHDRENINAFLQSMRSLRDVDEPAYVRVADPSDVQLLSAVSL